MIGSGLIRFHPQVRRPQDGGAMLDRAWQVIKAEAPKMIKDVLTEATKEGLKGLKMGAQRGRLNLRGGLRAAKQGAKRAIKRKATTALQKAATKRIRRDVFGLP